MPHQYILNGKEPIPCDDLIEWAKWFQTNERIVAQNKFPDDILVSTVFLGLDHNHAGAGKPILFETMIFGGQHDQYQARYETWGQAEEGHQKALKLVQND